MRRLLSFLLGHARDLRGARPALAGAFLFSLLGGVATTAQLAVLNSALGAAPARRDFLGLVFVALLVAVPLSGSLAKLLAVRVAAAAVRGLRLDFGRSLLAVPLRRLEETGAAPLLATLNQDLPALSNALAALPNLALNAALLVTALVYLASLSWRVFLLAVAILAPVIALYQLFARRAARHQERARATEDTLYGHLRGLLDGQKELKLSQARGEELVGRVLRETGEESLRRHVAAQTLYAGAGSGGQVMFFVVIGLVLFVLPASAPVSLAAMSGYALVILYMLIPTDAIFGALPGLAQARIALDRVESLGLALRREQETAADGAPEPLPEPRRLDLVDVTSAYRRDGEETFQLGPLRLGLPVPQLIFLTGGNGSGKTTLAKLLVGLYPPDAGEILWNGEAVKHPEGDGYRSAFSAVFSDFHLFGSLLGLADLDDRAREHLRLLRLEEKVRVEDGVLSTLDLSQGERKRLALLVAWLEDRPFYLFDEWAADQDPEFKRVFYRRFLPELRERGKTVVVISHDERFYDVADRVLKLDYGRLAEDSAPQTR